MRDHMAPAQRVFVSVDAFPHSPGIGGRRLQQRTYAISFLGVDGASS
jgi:hypothetical protein